jgi:hypothetical protein
MGDQVKVRFALVCDDSRREENGKLIFIGVYGANIIIPHTPITLPLSLILFHETEKTIQLPFHLRGRLEDAPIIEATASVEFAAPRGISSFPGIPLNISKPGLLSFQIKIGDQDWCTVFDVPVTHQPPQTDPSAPEKPV